MFELLCRVPSIPERDALINALLDGGVDVVSPDRDVIVNLTTQPNLSLGAYSVLFEGYDIRVPSEQMTKARDILAEFRRRHDVRAVDSADEYAPTEAPNLDAAGRRFFACTFWSMAIPVVFNLVALYWFFRSRDVLKAAPVRAMACFALNILILAVGAVLALRSWSF